MRPELVDAMRALFAAVPSAGSSWLAERFGATPADVAAAAEVLGLHRVSRGEHGVEWHRQKPKAWPSNVVVFRRFGATVDDGEVE